MDNGIIIGIDGGANVGVCVWSLAEKRVVETATTTRHGALKIIGKYISVLCVVLVEDIAQNKPVFRKRGAANDKAYLRIAQNVGMAKESTRAIIEDVRALGINPMLIRPSQKKWSELYYRTHTGDVSRVSQHVRDAARLVVDYTALMKPNNMHQV